MSLNTSPYGPPQYYFYPPPLSGLTPITAPNPLPTVQAADTAAFTPKNPPKDTISIGKAAKYGALITTGSVLIGTGLNILKNKKLLKTVDKKILLTRIPRGMAVIIAEGALTGALIGYFLKRSQKQG